MQRAVTSYPLGCVDDYGNYVEVPAGSYGEITHDEGDVIWMLTTVDNQVVELEAISGDDVEVLEDDEL